MKRRRVFVDTWAWVALTVADDPNHARAAHVSADLRRAGARLVTSNFVVDEALTRIRYDASLDLALALARTIRRMVTEGHPEVVTVSPEVEDEALDWFGRYRDQLFSFTDCTSFAIMHTMQLSEAFTGDAHYAVAGFIPLAV